ncbi:MAG: hypothetical protein Q4D06_03065 [Coriobacteriia bacterium]|nr:hypothetical protein [Coriobacteriia bacterium]
MKHLKRLAVMAASAALAACAFVAPAHAAELVSPATYSVKADLECRVAMTTPMMSFDKNFGEGLVADSSVMTVAPGAQFLVLDLQSTPGVLNMTMNGQTIPNPYVAYVSVGEGQALGFQAADGSWKSAQLLTSSSKIDLTQAYYSTQQMSVGTEDEPKTAEGVSRLLFPVTADQATVELALYVNNDVKPSQFGGEGAKYKATVTLDWSSLQLTQRIISGMTAKLSTTSYTYTGAAKKPRVTIDGLTNGVDYSVSYRNNVSAGTATVTVTGKGVCTGTITKTFTIKKASQSLTVSAAKKYAKRGGYTSAVSVKGAKGTKVFVKRTGSSKYLTVTKTGKIKVSSKAKKGSTYSIKLKVYAKATANYKTSAAKYVTVKVKVS